MPERQIFGSSRLPGPLGVATGPRATARTEGVARPPGVTRRRARPSTPAAAATKEVVAIGRLPDIDGEVNTYSVSEFAVFWVPETSSAAFLLDAPPTRMKRSRKPRKDKYQVVFVNGQKGNPRKHMMQACALAAVSGGPVRGVYNKSENLAADTLKSLWLKLTSSALMSIEAKVMDFFKGQKASEETIRNHLLSRDCPASAALFDLLLRDEYRDARIVGHSQGNIIICNAINGVIACRGMEAVEKMRVIAIASPTVFWESKNVTVYSMRNDLVGWLSGNLLGTLPSGVMGWSTVGPFDPKDTSEVVTGYKADYSNLLTHSFYLYLSDLWNKLQVVFR